MQLRAIGLIKQVLTPLFVPVADEAHQLPRGVQREGARAPLQFQPGLFRSAVALVVVALVAAGHQIFPRRPPASGAGHDVIQSQLGAQQSPPAELAGVAVTQQNVLPRKRAALLRDVPVGQQANHRRHLQRPRRGMELCVVVLLDLGHALEHQHHGAANRRRKLWNSQCVSPQQPGSPGRARSWPCCNDSSSSRSFFLAGHLWPRALIWPGTYVARCHFARWMTGSGAACRLCETLAAVIPKTWEAPAPRNARAQASSVAPVVITSSTSKTLRLSTRLPGRAAKAPRTVSQRSCKLSFSLSGRGFVRTSSADRNGSPSCRANGRAISSAWL